MITCRICERGFQFLPPHLRHSHQITTAFYRRQFDISAGEPLADNSHRVMQAEKMRRMLLGGWITIDHLPEAIAAARTVTQLPPGAKRANGRNADHARDYQRTYRQKRDRTGGMT